MTSVEKRRSGRKSGVHRKHSDGGYSDTSSGGSFLDETDREVSNLTDRAFRSLCIGDEAVYNDSDLCPSSPCNQRDRQLAFGQSGLGRGREDREELKRAAHESFSLRVQQYGQDWIHEGMCGAQVHRDPQWEVYGQQTQGRVSATFQHAFVEASQKEKSLREEHLTFLSNGATELSLQQRRSRSRVSSLIRAFNSEGHRDGAAVDGKLREWNDETSWDKSALMSIQRELSEFSYQQHFNNGQFPLAAPFSARDTNYYSSEVASVTHMNSDSSFMRSSHSKRSLSAQVNCNSNFFIHSEYSPFKVWRDHNRFPFKEGEVSGFMHRSEFPKWYETPMYKELSLETHSQGPYTFEERCINNPRNNLAAMVHPTPPRSTSTSTVLQKTLAVEKRCESELASHYPHRKRTQSLGNNRLTSQRPSTASPTTETSQRVRDTIRSAEALRQKIKMMTEQNMATAMMANQQESICSNDSFIPFGNTSVAVPPNVVSSKSGTAPFNVSQLLTPVVHAHQEAETSEVPQYVVSPQPVEHPPVRAESRGATPDVRMSSYKSRATSLLFNLKDNRKRVKSTYSPTKFKGLDASEKNKQSSVLEPRDTVIDIPDFPDLDNQFSHIEEASRSNAPPPHYVNQYHSTGSALTALSSQPSTAHTSQNSEYTLKDYQAAQVQGHSGFTDFIPEIYTSNQLVNGQGLQEDSFAPYKQGMINHDHAHRLQPSYTATDMQRLNADRSDIRDYSVSEGNAEPHFNENVGREFTKVDRYQLLKDSKHYSDVSSQDRWRQTTSQDTEKLGLKADIAPWKQEMTALIEKDRYAQTSQRTAEIKGELNLSRDKHREENQQSLNKELEKTELGESLRVAASHKTSGLVNPNTANHLPQYAPFNNNIVENQQNYRQQQPGAFQDNHVIQTHYGNMEENDLTQSYKSYTEQENRKPHDVYPHKETNMVTQETAQRKYNMQIPMGHETQSLHSAEPKPLLQHHVQSNSVSHPDSASILTMANQVKETQPAGVKVEQVPAEHIKAPHAQVELAKAQPGAQVEQPKVESAELILAGHTSSEKAKAEEAKAEATRYKRVEESKVEQIQEEKRTREDKANLREKQEEQEKVKRATEEANNITEEAGAVNLKDEEGEQLKAGQGEVERLKQHVKTQGVKREQPGQARAQHPEQTIRERIKAEQVERERREAEETKTEKVKAEQIEAEGKKLGQMNGAGAQQEKVKVAEGEKVKVKHIKAEDLRREKTEEDSHGAGQVNAEQSTTETSKRKGANDETRRGEQTKLEQTKLDLGSTELTKTKHMQEKWTKPAAKLTLTQHGKMEPDRVEQVKTELAKAKAELAKIKEKMRGEHKQKARTIASIKEDNITNRDVTININKSSGYNVKDNTTQVHQQREESTQNRNRSDFINRGADDYERLREKYGFTNAVLTNINKESTVENHFLNNANETADKGEKGNIEKSKHEHSPTNGLVEANTENKGVTGSQYVHSESSKICKLSVNYSPAVVDKRVNTDTVADKIKDRSDEKSDKCDSVKQTDDSQQSDPDLTKPPLLERKPKSAEHSVGSSKDSLFTPVRALSHKDRAQSKQEILTSKIKAHAEKEISAIKEKGFAMRDGFNSKNPAKQVAGGQSVRQRPASQEASKKHGSTMSSNITPKQQMEPTGIQMAPGRPVSPLSSAVTPVTAASGTSQLADRSQKNVPKEPEKSCDFELEPHTEANQTQICAVSIDEGLQESQKSRKQDEENYGKLKEGLDDDPAVNTSYLTKNNEIPQIAESKQEAVLKDSAPSLNLALGRGEGPMADDSLQIMGITVTVRERTPSLNESNSTQEQIHAEGKECSNSGTDKSTASSTSEVFTEKPSSMEVSTEKTEDAMEQKTAQTKVAMNSHHVQETSTLGMRKNCVYLEGSSVKLSPQNEKQLQEPLSEKSGTSPVTATAKSKDLTEAQPLLYKEDTKTREILMLHDYSAGSTKNDEIKSNPEESSPHQRKILDSKENFPAKVVNTTISNNNDSFSDGGETVTKPSRSRNTGGTRGPLPEEKMLHSLPAKRVNKTSPSHNLTQNESIQKSPELQNTGTNIKENNEVDDNVHIDSIAIRVVPAVTGKDKLETAGKQLTPAATSDVVAANEHKQDATASYKEKVHTSDNDGKTKDITQASTEKHMQDSVEDKLGVQYVLSSVRKLSNSLKTSNQQNNLNATSVNTQNEDKKPEKVKKSENESTLQAMEGDYFQVQGLKEANNSINVGDMSAGTLKTKEFLGLSLNKAEISSNSYKEEQNTLGQTKTVESSTVSVRQENIKRKNSETEYNWESKQSEVASEKKINNEKPDVGQANHTERQPITTTRERQRLRYFNPPKENAVKEKYEGRVSTIPEISAIADYARLKVIVSEDRENTVQDFAPNKKEGFFPLIQTRHSRRPVPTVDPKDISEKEESLPNKTEGSAKVSKEPKALVFPITEKEHQRTGMFKLGDKDKQDKMPLDVKSNEQHAQHLTEINKSPPAQTEPVAGAGTLSIHQPRNHTLQKMSSSALKTTESAYEGLTYVNRNSYSQPTLGQMHIVEENMTSLKNNERAKNLTKDGMMDKLKEASLQEVIKAKQQTRANQQEESATSLAKDDTKSAQRIEDRRALEAKATAVKIQEEQETLREAERIAEEERKIKHTEEQRAALQLRAKQREEERRRKEDEEKSRAKTVEERKTKLEGQKEQIRDQDERKRLKQQEEERTAQEEHQKKAAQEEQQRRASQEELQRRAAQEELQRRAAQEELQRRAAQEELQRRAAQEEQLQRAAQEELQRRAAQEELQQRAAQEELQRRAAQEEQLQRAAQEELQRRAAQEELQRRAAQEEQQRRAAQVEQQRRAAQVEQQQRTAQVEQQQRAAPEEQQKIITQKEQQRRTAQEEQQRRPAQEEQQRRAAQEEQQRAAQEEQQRRAAQEEQQRRAAQEEQQRAAQEEQQRRAAQEEQQRRAAQVEQKTKAAQVEHHRRTAQEEQQRRAAQEEHQRRIAQVKQQRRSVEEEQQRTAQAEQQRRPAEEELQRRAAQAEQQRRAAEEELQRRAAQAEQQRRAAEEELQRRAAQEEQQRRAAEEELQRRVAQEEQQRRAAEEELQRRAAQEEQQRRIFQEEQQWKAAQEEQQKRAEQQRRISQELQKTATQEKQQRTISQEEQQRRAAQEENQRRIFQEEQQKKAAQGQQQKRTTQKEQEKNAAHEEQQWQVALTDEHMRARQIEEKILADIEEQKKRKLRQLQAAQISEEGRIKHIQGQNRAGRHIEEYRRERQKKEEWMRTRREEEGKTEQEKTIIQQTEQRQADEEGSSLFGESHAALKEEEKKATQDQTLAQKAEDIRVQRREEGIKLDAHKVPEMEEQKTSQRMDALQYYTITSTESERTPRGRQQGNNPSGLESPEGSGSHSGPYRPHAPASPAASLPRSNASSPAPGAKPSMFRVKDNTVRGSSLTKSVKPHFHKNFGDDFRVGSPMERVLERGDEGQETNRRSAATPIHPDTGLNRLATIKESSTLRPASSSQDYSAPPPHHRPYSRRSIALDEDDSRSVISNMSEDAESFASCATDVSNARGLYDSDRPESACSFSSDVSRSLGKPPAVPPKSEKALQRAKRLTSRRIKKELSKAAPNHISGIEKPPQEVSNIALSSSAEVHSPNHHAVASPHFSPPVSLAHAPALGPGLPLLHTGHQSSHPSAHVSPHATGPISLPAALPRSTAPVTLTVASPHTTSFASHTANTKTVAHIPSSPTLYHVNHPAPVTKYHVESSYPQAYPLTQRKVLQDLGSGQYYVVDVPVQVKTKTFFDPETGKYVQLNVRESGQSASRPQPQQTYPQPHLQPQMKPQQQTLSQAPPAGSPYVLYQGYHGYPQNYQPISSMPSHRPAPAATPHQDQQPVRENHSCAHPDPDMGQNSEGPCYSPEKAPYMDTVCNTEKTVNRVYNTQSFPECDTNSQPAGSSACENDNAAPSHCQPCDIIPMSELEDFMDVSDW